MRIALVCHVRHPIAPPFMGGMEAHSWHLAQALIVRGHDVTLFASGDSDPSFRIHPILAEHYDRIYPWHDFHGSDVLNAYLDAAFTRCADALEAGGFDVVHNNCLSRIPVNRAAAVGLPMVTSLHVPPFGGLKQAVSEATSGWTRFTVTSDRQRAAWWPGGAPGTAHVVHNGIDPAAWPFVGAGDGSAVWSGRITPTKGTHLAVRAAAIAGMPLTLYGAIEHRDYYQDEVRPFLDDRIVYGGHLGGADLAAAIGRASAMLFTPLWDEPFGLAAIEAMACGLPVAAIENGAVREVIGEAGCYAPPNDPEGLAAALRGAMMIDRRVPRARVERLFTVERMVDRYEDLYGLAIAAAQAERPRVRSAVSPRSAYRQSHGSQPALG